MPLKFWKILHRPDVVPPPTALLPADGLCIEHLSDRPRDLLILELDPAFREVNLFRGRKLLPQIRPLGIYAVG